MNKRILTGLLAAALAIGVPAASPAAAEPLDQTVSATEKIAPKGTQATLHEGHADLGPSMVDGKLELFVRDDSQRPPVHRHLDDLVVEVPEAAHMELPGKKDGGEDYRFTGAQPGQGVWVIPQTQITGVPWLGWNTQAPSLLDATDGGVNLEFMGHQGPGSFSVFVQSGAFEAPEAIWQSTESAPQKIWVDADTHAHANWLFTEPGVHLVSLRATATLKNGQTASVTRVLRFAVAANEAEIGAAREATWDGNPDEAQAAKAPEAGGSHTGLIAGGIGAVLLLLAVLAWAFLRGRKEA